MYPRESWRPTQKPPHGALSKAQAQYSIRSSRSSRSGRSRSPSRKAPPWASAASIASTASTSTEDEPSVEQSLERCQAEYAALQRQLPSWFLEERVVQPLVSIGCAIEFAELPDAFVRPFKEQLIELLGEYTLVHGGPYDRLDKRELERSLGAVNVDITAAGLETTLHLRQAPRQPFESWVRWFYESSPERFFDPTTQGLGAAGSYASAAPRTPSLSWRLALFAEDPENIVYQGDLRLLQPYRTDLIFSLLKLYGDKSRVVLAE
jgi:hypothetical protein